MQQLTLYHNFQEMNTLRQGSSAGSGTADGTEVQELRIALSAKDKELEAALMQQDALGSELASVSQQVRGCAPCCPCCI